MSGNVKTLTYPHTVVISTNGEIQTPSSLAALIDSKLMEKRGSQKVLKKEFWSFLGRRNNWIQVENKYTTTHKRAYYYSEQTDFAYVVMADIDTTSHNRWRGYLKNYKVKVPVKVDDCETVEYGFRVQYDCQLLYDRRNRESVHKVPNLLKSWHRFEPGNNFWLCPDNDGKHVDGYYEFGTGKISANSFYDGTTFRLNVRPLFIPDSEQEIDAFNFTALNIIKATITDTSNSNVPSIEFETSTDHGLMNGDRVIVKGCAPEKLNIQSDNNISKRGIEIKNARTFRVIDPYVGQLIQDDSISKDVAHVQTEAVAYLDTSDFVILAESLAAAIDFDNLINDVKEKYGGVEIFKREMVSVGDRGKLVGWINEQLQILQFPNASDDMLYDTDTYRGMISLKRYYKSMNEELYNGLGIGLGCNRDTSNLSGIQKTYCESSDEPCGCYTLGCMVFQEATDNRLETHLIQSAESAPINGDDHIKFTTDHAHGLSTHDNVIIERCSLKEFNVKTKKGVVIGPDPCVFYVKMEEYHEDYYIFMTEKCYQFEGRVYLSQNLPTKNWDKLKQLNSSEPQTFIEKFSLNATNAPTIDSKIYLPLQGLSEEIKVKPGWGAVLRISLTDSNKNLIPSQWGSYGDNVDYLLGSRDILKFKLTNQGSVYITYDKRSGASASILGDMESNLINNPNGYIAIEILTVRSTYGEWLGYGVVLPADFGRVNGVAAVDKFIENMNQKFGLSGLSVKAGIEVKFAAVLEIIKIFEIKFGMVLDASVAMNSSSDNATLTIDIGVFSSASADIGVASGGIEIASLQRYVCTGRVEVSLMLLSLMNPFLGPLAMAFNTTQNMMLNKMKKSRVLKNSYFGQVHLMGNQVKMENSDFDFKNSQGSLTKQINKWTYSNKLNLQIGNYKSGGISSTNSVEKDYVKQVVTAQNLWFLDIFSGKIPIKKNSDKFFLSIIITLIHHLGLTVMTASSIANSMNDVHAKSAEELENGMQDMSDAEKEFHDFLKEHIDPSKVLSLLLFLRGICSNPSDLLPMINLLRSVKKHIKNFMQSGQYVSQLKGMFKNTGDIIKTNSKKSTKASFGIGLTQKYSSSTSLLNAKSEVEALQQVLNSNADPLSKCLSILEYQKTSPLPTSSRDYTVVLGASKSTSFESPRIPLFTGVRIGAELSFKIYGKLEFNLINLFGMQDYNASELKDILTYTSDVISSAED